MKYDISKFEPCIEAVTWYKQQDDAKTVWETCPRGDWMLWVAVKLGVDKQLLSLTKGFCANTVRHLMRDKCSIAAVDAAIQYGNGEISKEELDAAAYAAYAADVAADTARMLHMPRMLPLILMLPPILLPLLLSLLLMQK